MPSGVLMLFNKNEARKMLLGTRRKTKPISSHAADSRVS